TDRARHRIEPIGTEPREMAGKQVRGSPADLCKDPVPRSTDNAKVQMQQKCAHFVVTRLGLGIYDEERLNRLVDLFEAVTLPSLINQTSQDFIWLVSIDSDFPEKVKSRISQLLSPHPNFLLIPIDVTELINVRLACFDWVWDHYQDFILENSLLIDPQDYVITSVIDADDAWHRDVVS